MTARPLDARPAAGRPAINVALIGLGNCASSLVQGLSHYRGRANDMTGLMHADLGGYVPDDIRIVAAFDIDRRKVGRDVAEAIFAPPNCTAVFAPDIAPTGAVVRMGRVLDGVADHMARHPEGRTFLPADLPEPAQDEVVAALRDSGAQVVMNYLPVGSQQATEFYAECALQAGCAFVNAIPVFIASDPAWGERFRAAGLPVIGDDIKAQMGATIVHRVLTDLFARRGVALRHTYQLNIGGNTDFLNMTNPDRLESKRLSKTEAVQAVAATRLEDGDIHVGPSDYVAWQKDNKVCFLRMEGELFGGVPMNLELRLSVEDSPNSAGVAIDMIRCARLALDRGLAGPIHAPAAWFCKHPPKQTTDDQAYKEIEEFIENREEKA